jgi:hypothetical protein
MLKASEIVRDVPFSWVMAIAGPGGRRYKPRPACWSSGFGGRYYGGCAKPEKRHRVYESHSGGFVEADGNLQQHEYRYYMGKREPVLWAKCRFCYGVFLTRADRERHQNARGCPKNLEAVYKLMLEKKAACVVCGAHVYNQSKWGVPMCNGPCINNWKFDQDNSFYLEDWKRKALSEGRLMKLAVKE